MHPQSDHQKVSWFVFLQIIGIFKVIFQIFLSIILTFLLIDFIDAFGSSACSAPPTERTHDCYLWGMTEGPMEGGSWGYTNKERYLATSAIICAGLGSAICIPFVVKSSLASLLLMAATIFMGIRCLLGVNEFVFTMFGW
jgi:hypothetical protein